MWVFSLKWAPSDWCCPLLEKESTHSSKDKKKKKKKSKEVKCLFCVWVVSHSSVRVWCWTCEQREHHRPATNKLINVAGKITEFTTLSLNNKLQTVLPLTDSLYWAALFVSQAETELHSEEAHFGLLSRISFSQSWSKPHDPRNVFSYRLMKKSRCVPFNTALSSLWLTKASHSLLHTNNWVYYLICNYFLKIDTFYYQPKYLDGNI